jgi:hypothetical protein
MRTLTTALFAATVSVAAASTDDVGYLHVLVDRLPQCEYGVGFEHPWVLELRDGDDVLARTDHGGVYLGSSSILASLYVPEARAGRYELVIERCPSLLDDPRAAVACAQPEVVARERVSVSPRGLAHPEVVRLFGLRERCLDGSNAQPP